MRAIPDQAGEMKNSKHEELSKGQDLGGEARQSSKSVMYRVKRTRAELKTKHSDAQMPTASGFQNVVSLGTIVAKERLPTNHF